MVQRVRCSRKKANMRSRERTTPNKHAKFSSGYNRCIRKCCSLKFGETSFRVFFHLHSKNDVKRMGQSCRKYHNVAFDSICKKTPTVTHFLYWKHCSRRIPWFFSSKFRDTIYLSSIHLMSKNQAKQMRRSLGFSGFRLHSRLIVTIRVV